MPSKKERAKQRKAKKVISKSPTSNDVGDNSIGGGNDNQQGAADTLKLLPTTSVVAQVKRGNHSITDALSMTHAGEHLYDCQDHLVNVLPVVLEFLQRCEDETFDEVMADVRGDLASPFVWVLVILRVAINLPSCRLQIVETIGPLVRCMCSDTKRVFFQSNKHWGESIRPFVDMISIIVLTKSSIRATSVSTLLKYDGLLSSIVQWGFWEKKLRPDIAKELKAETNYLAGRSGSNVVAVIA